MKRRNARVYVLFPWDESCSAEKKADWIFYYAVRARDIMRRTDPSCDTQGRRCFQKTLYANYMQIICNRKMRRSYYSARMGGADVIALDMYRP